MTRPWRKETLTMIEISKCFPHGGGLAPALRTRALNVALDWDTRQKSRFDFEGPDGTHYGVFLPRGTVVRGGDLLLAANGVLIGVRAAPQPVLRISAHPQQGSAFDLTRTAYHLGNRHVPIELKPDHLKIEPDHVLEEMLIAMGLQVAQVVQSFEPEAGAYAHSAHPPPLMPVSGHHRHDHSPGQGHVHGPHCAHGHGHDHGDSHHHD